ncbi:impB/mucB/samB family C-terminal domain-containing protein [Methylobacterium sp. UNC378MF]|nr:impB/mucB/samB family C-terminal domain-containing protein [Methylobacterium sp. UNC378MF]
MARSLSGRITERAVLDEVVARETRLGSARLGSARLGEKLRRQRLVTGHVTIFYHTSEHGRDEPIRSVSTTVPLPEHGSDTLALIKAARHWTTQVSDFLHSRSHPAARALVR